MATDPKIQPCPKCGGGDDLAVYAYDNGWRHVECDNCYYLGPGAGNRRQAIKVHNERRDAARAEYLAQHERKRAATDILPAIEAPKGE